MVWLAVLSVVKVKGSITFDVNKWLSDRRAPAGSPYLSEEERRTQRRCKHRGHVVVERSHLVCFHCRKWLGRDTPAMRDKWLTKDGRY